VNRLPSRFVFLIINPEETMISIADLRKLLSMEQSILEEQTQGLTQADTLLQPQPGGNCMNWVLAHLLDNQVLMLETLGGESPVDKSKLSRYTRGSQPIKGEEAGLLDLSELLENHAEVNDALLSRLEQLTESDFEREITVWEKQVTLGWRVFFLHFHYTFHIGQLEFLRNLAGRTEQVI